MTTFTEHLPQAALLDKLWTRMSERGDFPMLSDSLRATMAAIDSDNLDFTALVGVVLSDFALTQKVIRLANSAMYIAFGGNITTVTRALMVLGMDAVGHLVVGLKLVDHFHQSNSQRIEAKLELNRALLSGCVARRLTEDADLRAGEEATVCTLMRQVGKLLVAFYLDVEWDAIRQRAAELGVDEASACAEVLGVGFDEIGREAATRWRLPDTIRTSIAPFDPHEEPEGQGDPDARIDRADHERRQWLRAVSDCSTEVAAVMTAPGLTTVQRDARLAALAQRFTPTLDIDADALVAITRDLAHDETSDTVLREIVALRANAAALERAAAEPQATLDTGLADLRALPSENQQEPVLALASESVLASLALSRTVMFVRGEDGTFAAKLGFGHGVEAALGRMRFHETFEPDVFHLAISNSVGIFIEDAHEPKILRRLPGWYRDTLHQVHGFVLLPVRTGERCVALLYGDWSGAQPTRRISHRDMATLNHIGAELGRFFAKSDAGTA
ncbi:HDOD domain-containing protein [Burkholderia glumae]|uniref:HDOD domain-containing protein n=1 Tax=Burkholderia glumae TaxID=337 RepID=UPI0021518218|nr:HDOD domain-containing protein [Burkholderia glumae]UVS95277.1 HDOD domain-containing protein [Burkholderia glumae]